MKRVHRYKPIITCLFIWYSLFNLAFTFLHANPTYALNKVSNWNFASSATGWSAANNNGTDVCGGTGSLTSDGNMATFAYDGALSGHTSYKAVTTTGKAVKGRVMIAQSFTVPGSGAVKAHGQFDYYANSTAWNATANSNWIRLDIYDSNNSTFVGNLGCASFNSNQAWTSSGVSNTITLNGGTTYTIRGTLRGITKNTNGSPAITLGLDNISVNTAPTGVLAAAPANTTSASVSWTASTAGTGAAGLHATTPYKVYRNISSGLTTADFLSNSTTNSYTDVSTTGNTTYYYAVADVDANNIESPFSAEVSVLTRPDVPGSVSFSNVTSNAMRISWVEPTGGASSYKVERCLNSGCSDYAQIASNVTNAYFDDSGLNTGTTYRYRIQATNITGDGQYSTPGEQDTVGTIVSVSITSDGIVSYGLIPPNSTVNTTSAGLNDTQVALNDGNVTATLNIKSSNAAGGTGWTLGSDPGSNTFVHYFSTNSGSSWTKFVSADVYQTLAAGVSASATRSFDLQITTPTSVNDAVQKNITITIQAVGE